jgi:acetylornithine/N-succinyldiaminopimelate aminotransferase
VLPREEGYRIEQERGWEKEAMNEAGVAEAAAQEAKLAEIVERERRYLLPTYARYALAIERGKGVFVYDTAGRRYLDLVGGLGVNALGHAHPRIVKAIREQAARVIHTSNLYYHEYQGRLAEKLCALSGLGRAFFANSGTEAVEGALKLARMAGHAAGGEAKSGIVALDGSFHGRTFGAISMTGQPKHREGFQPLLPGVTFVPLNDGEALRAAVNDATCAIVLEPIQGEGGIVECAAEFLRAAREAADRHRAVLIFDEIQCGLGRTGAMFAYQQMGVAPDVVTVAKPLAAGLPLGAFLVREELGSVIGAGKHGTTFGGGPLACRVALEYLAVVEEEKLLENVQKVGAHLTAELQELARRYSGRVKEARGRGFMQALELREPSRPLVEAAMAEGVLFNSTQETVLRLLPPFLLTEKQAERGLRLLRKLLGRRRSRAS